jgi:hypothetical protein
MILTFKIQNAQNIEEEEVCMVFYHIMRTSLASYIHLWTVNIS